MEKHSKKPPIRRSQAEREDLVAQWRASGQSVPQFAAERGLATSSLYQWIHPRTGKGKGKGKGKTTKRRPATKASFAEVNVIGPAAARNPTMTVSLRSGHSVSFEGAAVDPAWLESVLKVVAAC